MNPTPSRSDTSSNTPRQSMEITCPQCKTTRDIGEVKIPAAGVTATCGNCQMKFPLRPEAVAVEAESGNGPCPACGYAGACNESSESCPLCGVFFAKYRARATPETAPLGFRLSTNGGSTICKQLLPGKRLWLFPIALLAAAGVRFGHDWKLNRGYVLQPSCWQGEMTFRGKQHPFMLVIQSAENGKLDGYMDWTETSPRYRLAIRGTNEGNHLIFEDYKFIEGSGEYGLHDKQDVYIEDNQMSGSAKNGTATMHAVEVAIRPDVIVEQASQ